MELIDDWKTRESAPPTPRLKGQPVSRLTFAQSISAALEPLGSQLGIVNVHCYEDVGYPWVQVVFEGAKVIRPITALRVGEALASVTGTERVYLNSLRPMAVYFVLEPAFGEQPDLPASRYGARLADVQTSWGRPYPKPSSN